MTFFSPKIYSQFGKNMSKINICYKSNMSFIIAKKKLQKKLYYSPIGRLKKKSKLIRRITF